jgi:hypothetical protein
MKMPVILAFISLICCSTICAQPTIHVTEEPYHKPVYKSDSLTVIELYMEKGDTSMFHLHEEPILYLTLNGAKMWLNTPEAGSRVVELPSGWIGSDNYDAKTPFIHQIAVEHGGPLHLIAILKNQSRSTQLPSEDDSEIYRENDFAVKIGSITNSEQVTERINIVFEGSALKGEEEIGPGNFFFPDQELSRISENFKFYRVYF